MTLAVDKLQDTEWLSRIASQASNCSWALGLTQYTVAVVRYANPASAHAIAPYTLPPFCTAIAGLRGMVLAAGGYDAVLDPSKCTSGTFPASAYCPTIPTAELYDPSTGLIHLRLHARVLLGINSHLLCNVSVLKVTALKIP